MDLGVGGGVGALRKFDLGWGRVKKVKGQGAASDSLRWEGWGGQSQEYI